jgi:hypothetical protein
VLEARDGTVAGIVVSLGHRSYRYDDRLYVTTLDRLWR